MFGKLIVWQSDDDDVELEGEQFVEGRERLCAELMGKGSRRLCVDVEAADKVVPVECRCPLVADQPTADDANAKRRSPLGFQLAHVYSTP